MSNPWAIWTIWVFKGEHEIRLFLHTLSPKHLDKNAWVSAMVSPQKGALTVRAKDLCSSPQHSFESWAWLHTSEAQVLGRRAGRSWLGACWPATLAETGAFRFTKRLCLKSKAKRNTGGHLRYSPVLCMDPCRYAPNNWWKRAGSWN